MMFSFSVYYNSHTIHLRYTKRGDNNIKAGQQGISSQMPQSITMKEGGCVFLRFKVADFRKSCSFYVLFYFLHERKSVPSLQKSCIRNANNLSRRELGNSLGSLRNGMLGKLSGQHKTDGSLNLT